MADLVITAANVVAGSNANFDTGLAGETITAGQPVYRDTTTQKWMKADSNSATSAARQPKGIALNGASLNQPLKVQTLGDITIGAAITAGTSYYLSDTPGGICPFADVGSGEYVCVIGVAKSTTVLMLLFAYPNVAL
jgi:hypothetical protein